MILIKKLYPLYTAGEERVGKRSDAGVSWLCAILYPYVEAEAIEKNNFVMLNGVKHLFYGRHSSIIDPSLSLRMTK